MLETIAIAFLTSALTVAGGWFLAQQRIRREYLLQFRAETVAKALLSHRQWRLRTFATIKHHLGGFNDDELRRILVQAGAVRFVDAQGIEVWGLIDRNLELLEREIGTAHN